MAKIFCIIGKSGTGKDTIFNRLKNDSRLNTIVGYTTRPMRENEVDGQEYFFVDRERLEELKKQGKVIECRDYNTVHGIWSYFTVADNQIKEDNNYIYIATLESFNKLVDYYGSDSVIPIYIEVDDGIRLERALQREQRENNPKYKELCRRFIADCDDFSEENIKQAGIEKRFVNDNLDNCVKEIQEYIFS